MKNFSLILVLVLIFQLVSCKQGKNDTSATNEFGNIPTALADSLRKIGVNIQQQDIDPTKDNTIIGQQGTAVYISANSLIDENGKPITKPVIIQLKENYSIADMIGSNLQTLHNDEVLESAGMINLTATTQDGAVVKIDKTKPVRIEFPSSNRLNGAKFFKGKRDEQGNINWVTVEEPAKKLIPFPIKLVAPRWYFECRPDFGITKDPTIWKDTLAKVYYTYDDITKYENTLLATREFKERYYSYCMPDLTKIYIENLDKNMWEIDEMMVQYFIKDSTERVNFEISSKPPKINGNPITPQQDSAYHWLIDNEKKYGHSMISCFKYFAAQKLTKIDEAIKVDTSKIKELNKAFLAYETIDFGWINCDIFYKDPKAERIKLYVQTNETPTIINIVFKDRKIILDGIEDGNNKFRFTKDKEGYNKLPKGDTATILAIGYRDNKILFDTKQIIIGQNETETLDMKMVSGDELAKRLKNTGS